MEGVIPVPEGSNDEQGSKSGRLWTPGGETARPESRSEAPAEDELSEEELRQRIEEVIEKITVADIILDMMISLSSLAYQRMGIPPDVNGKYKDMEQARMAIDCLDAMAGSLEGRVASEQAEALKGTIANLKLNFAKES